MRSFYSPLSYTGTRVVPKGVCFPSALFSFLLQMDFLALGVLVCIFASQINIPNLVHLFSPFNYTRAFPFIMGCFYLSLYMGTYPFGT